MNDTLTVGAPVTYIGDDPLEHARPGDTGEVVGWPPLRDRFVVQFAEGREILWPGELEAVTAAQQPEPECVCGDPACSLAYDDGASIAIAEALTGVFREANEAWQHGDMLGSVISVGPEDPRYSLMGRSVL